MKKELHIGCSSFNSSYWKEVFYPKDLPRNKWFEFYCQHFDTYEMNGTFYRFPRLKTFQDMFDKSPEHFLISVKAPKEITHIRLFVDCGELLKDFYSRCAEGLQHKLGCILFQFPPSYDYTPERLDSIIRKLDTGFRNVLEFRHRSWWIPEVWNQLVKNSITLCSVSHPQLPETIFTVSPLIYVRLHGKPKMFYSSYSTEELAKLKDLILTSNADKAFVYFNNTASTAGIMNALEMEEIK
ncbi:DUF72 domain-containing protein [Flavobacterium wongokense]|uniref:DUF72 domain-containing protein n=1 Tax=Flavobacterium wongokense TaxID=2910674 RepID=UPI001F335B2B|nr:DUF72 domain-containing protein [Flavobacterium sp. WG47]MCF6132242.1 DUF72 domain-containing protein [Flavobacterium sp. WG47]